MSIEASEMTPKEADLLGREAVVLEFPCAPGLASFTPRDFGQAKRPRVVDESPEWFDALPDFRDELTQLACIPWVRRVWGEGTALEITYGCEEGVDITVFRKNKTTDDIVTVTGATLVHACVAAVWACVLNKGSK